MPNASLAPAGRDRRLAGPAVPLGGWTYGNRARVLENGEAFFPAVFAAIACARRQVLVETFILFDDPVGRELRAVLIAAARRGLRVALTIDGYGSPDLSAAFIGGMTEAGVDVRCFDPRPRILGVRFHVFRRLHRKIVVVDSDCAFVGGLNFSLEHMRRFGVESKQDYAVRVEGPIVDHIRALADIALAGRDPPRTWPWWRSRVRAPAVTQRDPGTAARLVWRDNAHHRDDIELHYRMAIRQARREVLIANAYFFPSYRMVRELRAAARRGVRVCLVLQGRSDHTVMTWGARSLYAYLMSAGVEIHEYGERALHGKIAVVDDGWSTVGSSNLDPASLGLNLEANLLFDDPALAADLRQRIGQLMGLRQCRRIEAGKPPPRPLWGRAMWYTAFHLMRMLPGWGRWFPVLRLQQVCAVAVEGEKVLVREGNGD